MKNSLVRSLRAIALAGLTLGALQVRARIVSLHRSRFAATISLLTVLGIGLLQPAGAAPGGAPPSQERRVLSGLHTDAIAVFAEEGALVLGTRADVDGSLGVRLDPNLTVFNVEESARATIPDLPAYAFLGAPGGDVWIAPESNPGGAVLWPGFSTEGVTGGFVDGNQLTIGLDAVTGPGTVHLYQTGAFGEIIRRLSGDGAEYRSWTVSSGQHAHANWAFSAAGAYTLTVSVTATVDGTPVSVTQDYTFVVGDVPAAVGTGIALHVHGGSTVTVGTAVELHAEVSPADAAGYVEFRSGATVLGHEEVVEGEAELEIDWLSIGTHSITAHFVPLWLNDFTTSASEAETITVTDESGVPFSITGIQESYQPGDTLTATLSGYTLTQGQQVRWLIRRVGSTFPGSNLRTAASLTYTNTLDISWDSFEISAQVRQGSTVIATTPWVPISVAPMPGVDSIGTEFPAGTHYAGDILVFPLSRELAAGETARLAWLSGVGTRWQTAPTILVGNTLQTRATWSQIHFTQIEFAIQIIRDGVAVAQSDRVSGAVIDRQVLVEGLQGVYRPGQTLNVTAQVIPPMDGLTYRWSRLSDDQTSEILLKESTGPEALTLSLPMTIQMDTLLLYFYAYAPNVNEDTDLISYWFTYLSVSDTTDQIFAFSNLGDHYHQGNPINLVLGADPSPATNDTIVWEWRWPGTDWTIFPGASGLSKSLVAEQALDGLEIRATLTFADTNDSIVAGPVTIHVDDHGAAASQQLAITGAEGHFHEGDTVTLTRVLPANGSTILTEHRWEWKAAGSEDWTVIAGATGEVLTFTATLTDDGAQYRVTFIKPNGELAYGPSPAVTLEVGPGTPPGFAITGIAASYQPGDTLEAQVVGVTLEDGHMFRWKWRPIGSTHVGTEVQRSDSTTYSQAVDASHHDRELSVEIRQCQNATCSVGPIVAQTAWVPINVVFDAAAPTLTRSFGETPLYFGDSVHFEADGLNLQEGETSRFVHRSGLSEEDHDPSLGYGPISAWSTSPPSNTGLTASSPAPNTVELKQTRTSTPHNRIAEVAVQVLRDGVPVRQSEPHVITKKDFELPISGLQSLYFEGTTANLSAQIYPVREGDDFTYEWQFSKVSNFPAASTTVWGTSTTVPATVSQVVNVADHDQGYLRLRVLSPDGLHSFVTTAERIYVTDDPDAQLFFFNNLAAHYHQGDNVHLNLTVGPDPGEGDEIIWEWQWPGADWTPFPGPSGKTHTVIAEQALHDVQVRATLDFADEGRESIVADPVTIGVDDHGAVARQQPTVAGAENHYHSGETVTLTRVLPANGPTILTEHHWERKAAGSGDFILIEGATGVTLNFTATLADDGAQYRVAIMKPNGEVAYGPSSPVTLEVDDHGHDEPELGVLAQAYRVELLEPTNGGVNAAALGINEAGDVVGITRPTGSAQPQMTVVWERHGNHFHATELANLEGSQFSRGFDLSANRTVVGEAFNSGGNSIPIRWDQAGAPQHVTTLNEAGTGILNDIDEAGTAVGTASGRAVKVATDGTVTVLEEPDAGVEGATVNNYTATTVASGVVGGRASIAIPHGDHSHNVLYGVVWDQDGARLLGLPESASSPGVYGIASDGTAVGAVTLASKETAVLWSADGTPHVLPTPEVGTYTHASARSVANNKLVVGYVSQFAGNTSFGGAAVAWGAGGPVDLNALTVNLPEGVTLLSASDVNTAGQIVGTARTSDGRTRGFVLTPFTPPLTITGVADHYHSGDTVTLTAVQHPDTGEDHYHWFIKPAGATEFTVIPGALAGVYSFTAAEEHDGAEILVRLYDHDHELIAESAPITIHIDDHGHPEPQLSIAVSDDSVTLSIATEAGVGYQLESAPTVTGPWSPVGEPFIGTGQRVEVSLPMIGPAGFFQLRPVENP